MLVYFIWCDICFNCIVRLAKHQCVGTGQRNLHLKSWKYFYFHKEHASNIKSQSCPLQCLQCLLSEGT
jgi:hypothetical protein